MYSVSSMFLFDKDAIGEFLRHHSTGVLATVSEEGQPSTSTIYYIVSKHDEIFFLTKSGTTKSINLQQNNKAALTVVDTLQPIAVNMTGSVIEITDTAQKDEVLQSVTKLAYSLLHDYAPIIKLHKGSFAAMKFTPELAKLTDYSKPFGKIIETDKQY